MYNEIVNLIKEKKKDIDDITKLAVSFGAKALANIIYNEDGIIPIEVKASNNTQSKSLKSYMNRFKPKYAIRISTKNFGFENGVKSVPLYAAFLIK